MKRILTLLITICYGSILSAQNLIAVQNGSQVNFYTDFHTALHAAPSGATMYLPGGVIYMQNGNDTIAQTITIIGAGHYPDSTSATLRTVLNGNLSFQPQATNCLLSGFYIGSITPLGVVDNLNLKKLNISTFYMCTGTSTTDPSFSNFNVSECIISNATVNTSYFIYNPNCIGTFDRNVIDNLVGIFGVNVTHNYIGTLGFWNTVNGGYMGPPNQCTITNNIIANPSDYGTNIFQNNIFFTAPWDSSSNSTYISNIEGQSFLSTFTNAPNFTYNYSYDYHILSSSPARNAGTDGTNIGIYGTSYPYKESAVPSNPHIQFISIAPQTSGGGNLPVNIHVAAQNN